MTLKKNSTFCIRPFTSITSNSNGTIRACCKIKPNKSKFKSEKLFSVHKDGIKKYWASDYKKYLENQFLQDKKPSECVSCWDDEEKNLISHRIRGNREQKFLAKTNYIKYLKLLKKVDLPEAEEYEWVISNLCNLKCQMCSGVHSSKLLVENHAIGEELEIKQKEYNWSTQTKLDIISKLDLSVVKRMTFLGGEPLLVPEIVQLLEKISNTIYAETIDLTVVTNGTVINDYIFLILDKLKKLEIVFSLESTSKQNEYLRYPSKWEEMKKKLDRFQKLKDTYFYINCVVQNLNILYIDQLVDFAYSRKIHLNFTPIEDPTYLRIEILPVSLLKIALSKLEKIPKDQHIHCTNLNNLKKLLQAIINKNKSLDHKNFEEFKRIMILRDKYRKVNITDYMPEIGKLIYNKFA